MRKALDHVKATLNLSYSCSEASYNLGYRSSICLGMFPSFCRVHGLLEERSPASLHIPGLWEGNSSGREIWLSFCCSGLEKDGSQESHLIWHNTQVWV